MVVEELETTPTPKFQAQVYRINDIVGWHDRKELVLSPDFQRRKVWNRQGKSYLMDTIVKGMPMPQIFIREIIHPQERRTVREVVDGQQRISTILEFLDGNFTVLPSHNPGIARKKYEALPESVQQAILSYPLSVNILSTSDNAEVLGIFARLNSYSITLNAQEKLNAKYIGAFREAMNNLARKHLAYWEKHRILSNQRIARMADVELTADLTATMMTRLQNGKRHIDEHYKKYDDEFPYETIVFEQFDHVLSLVEQIVGIAIEQTEFYRVPLFYSLFTATYDIVFGFGCESSIPRKRLVENGLVEVNSALQELNEVVKANEIESEFGVFVRATKASTDKLQERQIRHKRLANIIQSAFE